MTGHTGSSFTSFTISAFLGRKQNRSPELVLRFYPVASGYGMHSWKAFPVLISVSLHVSPKQSAPSTLSASDSLTGLLCKPLLKSDHGPKIQS